MPTKASKPRAKRTSASGSSTRPRKTDLLDEKRVVLPQAGKPSRPKEAIRLAILDKNFNYRDWVKGRKARVQRTKA